MAQVQTSEARAFLQRVVALSGGPEVSLDAALKPSLQDEAALRHLFAADRQNARLTNPYVGLVDIFNAPSNIRTTRARVVKDSEDKVSQYVLPIADKIRRSEGQPSMVDSIHDFQKYWAVFTEGALSQLTNWNNIIAAGGSVLACLLPIPDSAKESKRTLRKYFHSSAYPTSDVDLFLWGMTPEQAEVKINAIFEAVRDSVPWDVTCVRTKHAISIHSQYPYRPAQIVLRLYKSPAEILAGFDVDAPCVMYDGQRVLANPRAIIAMMRQCNTVDVTRRSPSYELRLAKYASRGFEIYVPDLHRADVDPTKASRLLVLEKLSDPAARTQYLYSRRALRSRPEPVSRYMKRQRKYKGDLKSLAEIGGLEMNDYDVASLHIPYGPGWNARRIDKLIYQTDLGMNSTFNPKNKGRWLHRHTSFFGTMQECLEDCCLHCPEPRDEEERALEEREQKHYIKGRVAFIQDDPGRQSITGSFNPIDFGEWSSQAYVSRTEKLFSAIAALDRVSVQQTIKEGVEFNDRDHVGRTPLQLAIKVKAVDISCDLIEAGSRMIARLVDGRTCLHLAAQLDLPSVVQKMLEKSAANAEKAKEATKQSKSVTQESDENRETDEEHPSSEDDWSSNEAAGGKKAGSAVLVGSLAQERPPLDAVDIPEDNMELPDVLDVNVPDWDFAFTPLVYAIITGSVHSVDLLLSAGADPKLATKSGNGLIYHPLKFALLTLNEEAAADIVEKLLQAGATTSQADENLFSIFHAFVCSGKRRLVARALRADPNAKVSLNIPNLRNGPAAVYPLVSAITKGDYALVALLLAHGALVKFSEDDVDRAKQMLTKFSTNHRYHNHTMQKILLPVEASIACRNHLIHLLVDFGAEFSAPCYFASQCGSSAATFRFSLLDWVEDASAELEKGSTAEEQAVAFTDMQSPKTWQEHRAYLQTELEVLRSRTAKKTTGSDENQVAKTRSSVYLAEVKMLLERQGAKSWDDLYPDLPRDRKETRLHGSVQEPPNLRPQYQYLTMERWDACVGSHLLDQCDALFEACWAGDKDRIRELCLPSKDIKSSKPPIQVTVLQSIHDEPYRKSYKVYRDGAYTPLAVALLARRWDVARLVLAIAIAQYKKPDTGPTRFTTANIVLNDSDSDDEVEDEDSENKMQKFTDLASRPSALQCDTAPNRLFTQKNAPRVSRDGTKEVSGNVLMQAVKDADLEAFTHICDLKKLLPEPEEPEYAWIHEVLRTDSPDLLDEYIRRSGVGIELSGIASGEDESSVEEVHHDSKIYLGLSVHGKKRKDLATKGDNNAPGDNLEALPLLWQAASAGAAKIVEYLSTTAPLRAYRYYIMTGTSERAESLRKITDLAERFPRLLGVLPNSRNETAVVAAILGPPAKALSMTKLLISLYPAQARAYLHARIHNVGFTPLLLAVAQNLSTEYIDFLVASGVSVNAVDHRGWNVYHFVCASGYNKVLVHLLDKLPKDLSARLFTQASYGRLNTPLMLAVKQNKLRTIEILLQAQLPSIKASLAMREASGSMPVHVAVRAGFADISSLLISEGPLEALYGENGVGDTPLETASTQFLLANRSPGTLPDIKHLEIIGSSLNALLPYGADQLADEVKNIKEVMTELEEQGRLLSNSKLKRDLDSFVLLLDNRIKDALATPGPPAQTVEKISDEVNRLKTLQVVSAAVFASPGLRCLVHLSDVQKSVSSSLDMSLKNTWWRAYHYLSRMFSKRGGIRDEDLDAEEADEERQWEGVLRFRQDFIHGVQDCYDVD